MMKTLKKWSSAILVLLILCGVLLLTACDSDQDAVGNGGVDSATTQSVGGNGGEEIPTEPPTTEGGDSTQPLDPCIKGHTEVIDVAISATCTQPGKTEGKHCSVCGFVIVAQVEIPAGHTVVTDAAVAPTCTEKGKTEGRHCSVCNAVLVAQYELAANGHYFGAWSMTKEATRQEAGQQVRSCSCGATETTEIPAIEGVNPIVIVVAVVAGLGVAAAAAFIFLKRK